MVLYSPHIAPRLSRNNLEKVALIQSHPALYSDHSLSDLRHKLVPFVWQLKIIQGLCSSRQWLVLWQSPGVESIRLGWYTDTALDLEFTRPVRQWDGLTRDRETQYVRGFLEATKLLFIT